MTNKLSVLVIDDEKSLENVYTTFLAKIGAEVTYFDHPQKGWRAIEKEKYDLIITDLRMPVISGDEFISIVRASKLNAHTPIILCSGFINKLVVTETTRASKIYFLSKPFDSKALLDLVSKALGVKKSEVLVSGKLNENWLSAFSNKLSDLTGEKFQMAKLDHFEVWNFESISLNFYISEGEDYAVVSLLMKLKTFLKIAGHIQGTQYKELEQETLSVWQQLLDNVIARTSRVTFSKVLSQDIVHPAGQKPTIYKFSNGLGEVLVYLN